MLIKNIDTLKKNKNSCFFPVPKAVLNGHFFQFRKFWNALKPKFQVLNQLFIFILVPGHSGSELKKRINSFSFY